MAEEVPEGITKKKKETDQLVNEVLETLKKFLDKNTFQNYTDRFNSIQKDFRTSVNEYRDAVLEMKKMGSTQSFMAEFDKVFLPVFDTHFQRYESLLSSLSEEAKSQVNSIEDLREDNKKFRKEDKKDEARREKKDDQDRKEREFEKLSKDKQEKLKRISSSIDEAHSKKMTAIEKTIDAANQKDTDKKEARKQAAETGSSTILDAYLGPLKFITEGIKDGFGVDIVGKISEKVGGIFGKKDHERDADEERKKSILSKHNEEHEKHKQKLIERHQKRLLGKSTRGILGRGMKPKKKDLSPTMQPKFRTQPKRGAMMRSGVEGISSVFLGDKLDLTNKALKKLGTGGMMGKNPLGGLLGKLASGLGSMLGKLFNGKGGLLGKLGLAGAALAAAGEALKLAADEQMKYSENLKKQAIGGALGETAKEQDAKIDELVKKYATFKDVQGNALSKEYLKKTLVEKSGGAENQANSVALSAVLDKGNLYTGKSAFINLSGSDKKDYNQDASIKEFGAKIGMKDKDFNNVLWKNTLGNENDSSVIQSNVDVTKKVASSKLGYNFTSVREIDQAISKEKDKKKIEDLNNLKTLFQFLDIQKENFKNNQDYIYKVVQEQLKADALENAKSMADLGLITSDSYNSLKKMSAGMTGTQVEEAIRNESAFGKQEDIFTMSGISVKNDGDPSHALLKVSKDGKNWYPISFANIDGLGEALWRAKDKIVSKYGLDKTSWEGPVGNSNLYGQAHAPEFLNLIAGQAGGILKLKTGGSIRKNEQPALLHQGEMVLNKNQSKDYSNWISSALRPVDPLASPMSEFVQNRMTKSDSLAIDASKPAKREMNDASIQDVVDAISKLIKTVDKKELSVDLPRQDANLSGLRL